MIPLPKSNVEQQQYQQGDIEEEQIPTIDLLLGEFDNNRASTPVG